MKKRILWIDSIRFFACFIVAWSHFSAFFNIDFIQTYMNESAAVKFIMFGIDNGTMATVVFFVLAGYFASVKAGKSGSFMQYTIARYMQLMVGVLLAEIIVFGFAFGADVFSLRNTGDIPNEWLLPDMLQFSVFKSMTLKLVQDVIFFQSHLIGTFWCIQPLFIGSLLCFILERLQVRLIGVFLIFGIFFIASPNIYSIAIIAGLMLHRFLAYEEKHQKLQKVLKHPLTLTLLLVLTVLFYQDLHGAKSQIKILCYTISAVCFLLFCFHCSFAQKLLSNKYLARGGKICFGVYLLHYPVYGTIIYLIYPFFEKMGVFCGNLLVTILYYLLTFALAWICTKTVDWVVCRVNQKYKELYR